MGAQWLNGKVLGLRLKSWGSSLTGITALWHWARHINPSLVLIQPRKTRPYITERLLMEHKKNQIQRDLQHFHFIQHFPRLGIHWFFSKLHFTKQKKNDFDHKYFIYARSEISGVYGHYRILNLRRFFWVPTKYVFGWEIKKFNSHS